MCVCVCVTVLLNRHFSVSLASCVSIHIPIYLASWWREERTSTKHLHSWYRRESTELPFSSFFCLGLTPWYHLTALREQPKTCGGIGAATDELLKSHQGPPTCGMLGEWDRSLCFSVPLQIKILLFAAEHMPNWYRE